MALAGTVKAPTAAMLLLALVIAAAVNPSTEAEDDHAAAGWTAKSGRRGVGLHGHGDDGQKQKSFPAGLASCMTICGTQTTTCFLDCYKPVVGGADPVVALPFCILKCANSAVICASGCSSDIV